MYELRILSGLHRGATLPLQEDSHTIGASDDADVVLVDPGIKERHATLSKTEAGWLLSVNDGQLFDAESNREQSLIDLQAGEFARVGDVWISIMLESAPWVGPPLTPTDESLTEETLTKNETIGVESSVNIMNQPTGMPIPGAISKLKRTWHGPRIALSVMAATLVLSAAAAYAITSKSLSSDITNMSDSKMDRRQSVLEKDAKTDHMKLDTKNSGGGDVTPEALRKAFRKRLADADLIQQFDLMLEDDTWQMQADLDDEDARRFDRILRTFISENHISFPVHAKIVSSEGMLPFKISQVISGANPNIVTQDGQRLFIGEEFRGMRLVAIQDNHLTFAGKRKIEMNW